MLAISLLSTIAPIAPLVASDGEPMLLLFGDTHLHSNNSFDAYLNQNMSADPDTAYRYAKGLPVIHPYHRARVQIETPLDFLVVADHAEYLGVVRTVHQEGIPREELGPIDSIIALFGEYWLKGVMEDEEGMAAFTSVLPKQVPVKEGAERPPRQAIPAAATMSRSAWHDAVQVADLHNKPGSFTAMIGWEWSSIPGGANLHRVVFTSAGADLASRFQPYSSVDSMYPEDLWTWLEKTSKDLGIEFISIPHNSNISKGYMFAETTLRGEPYTAELAQRRQVLEPVAEITQIKGDSETLPEFSPDDPFADFETYRHYIQQDAPTYDPQVGDYIRPALLRGLAIEERVGWNPYRFGLIGSTDSHTGLASAEEPNFWGKLARDSIPENKSVSRRGDGPTGWSMSASGLAAVWAGENSRQAILEAFRRREVYGTTGPRIKVRVFGGWSFEPAHATSGDIDTLGRSQGVPMGANLPVRGEAEAPSFLVVAQKDPKSANLDRVQMVKGWLDDQGRPREHVYDIAWSNERTPDASGKVPPVKNTVDLKLGTYRNDVGSSVFSTVWSDPDFDASRRAFYYVRVLEIPTPRHSVFDAIALGLDPQEIEGAATIQERAYTSPIFYAP
tara:strand:+ start:1432 stop:3282 length:1851 start_codon:yes stop_codon:yes gene_type:complete